MSSDSVVADRLLQADPSLQVWDETGGAMPTYEDWRLKLAAGSMAVLALAGCSNGGAVRPGPTLPESGHVLFDDNFNGYAGEYERPIIVTGEGSHFSPGPGCPNSPKYIMTSGTLIVYKGEAITGNPTTETGDVPCDSTKHNDNNVYRLLIGEVFPSDISVSLDYTPLADVGPRSQHNSFDGFTVWIGNQPNKHDEDYGLYTVSIRDGGEVVIKKKIPKSQLTHREVRELEKTGDIANGGGYYAISQYIERPDLAVMGRRYHVTVESRTEPNGDVKLTLYVNGEEVISAVDDGKHAEPYRTGQVGVRLDYTKARFDNLKVEKLPTTSTSQRAASLGELSINGRSLLQIATQAGNPASIQGVSSRLLRLAA